MLVEYVWLDVDGNTRSKTRVIGNTLKENNDVEIPLWNFDGSSCGLSKPENSELILKPCGAYPDPFRGKGSVIALCEVCNNDMTPHESNKRHGAQVIFDKHKDREPLFGIEQEFYLEKDGKNLSSENKANTECNHYCSVGESVLGRTIVEETLKRCMVAGLGITGCNAEVGPSQWEVQVCAKDIVAADQLILLRYILNRTAEAFRVNVNYHPKPLENENGSGCHINFSTKETRAENGLDTIQRIIEKLEKRHMEHMIHYGTDNRMRMTGENETSEHDKFSHGVGNRAASVRIPNDVSKYRTGYLEDRRPASNMNPYVVLSLLMDTSMS
jgi:glutamine synthetase